MAVVFTDDPSEKDLALEVDQVRCLEKAQGPVTAEVQGLWSWNQWLRHVRNCTASPEMVLPTHQAWPCPETYLIPNLTPGLGLAVIHEHFISL